MLYIYIYLYPLVWESHSDGGMTILHITCLDHGTCWTIGTIWVILERQSNEISRILIYEEYIPSGNFTYLRTMAHCISTIMMFHSKLSQITRWYSHFCWLYSLHSHSIPNIASLKPIISQMISQIISYYIIIYSLWYYRLYYISPYYIIYIYPYY